MVQAFELDKLFLPLRGDLEGRFNRFWYPDDSIELYHPPQSSLEGGSVSLIAALFE